MSVSLGIPEALREYCGGKAAVDLVGEEVGAVLLDLAARHPRLAHRVLNGDGQLRSHLVVIQNDCILPREGLERSLVSPDDDLRIYTAVSGG